MYAKDDNLSSLLGLTYISNLGWTVNFGIEVTEVHNPYMIK